MKFNISTRLTTLILILSLVSLIGLSAVQAEQCGIQAGGALCPGGMCCSRWGWCGQTVEYCGDGCQSQCSTPPPPPPTPPPPFTPPPPVSPDDVSNIITKEIFEEMLPKRGIPGCEGEFYTYDAFISAARVYPQFGRSGSLETRKRELAAFFGQTSQETTGGNPQGPYDGGYCFVREINRGDYCVWSQQWPCAPGQQYYGRGPIQLSYNYNYGPAGRDLGVDLLNNPDLVATNPVISFETALWFWMTPQYDKPSCHDAITGGWTPTQADINANRFPGYGVVTNIINGGVECGKGVDLRPGRIGFFKRYCDILGATPGDNLDCNNQRPFGSGLGNPYPYYSPNGVLKMPVDQA